jgi:hypothetical protein
LGWTAQKEPAEAAIFSQNSHVHCPQFRSLTELKAFAAQTQHPDFCPISMDPAARHFHALVREGLDYEQIAHMVEIDGLDVDCTDQVGVLKQQNKISNQISQRRM